LAVLILFLQGLSSRSARIVQPKLWKPVPSSLKVSVFLSPEEEHAASQQSRVAKLWEECKFFKDKAWHERIQSEGVAWALARYGLIDYEEEVRTVSARILHELGMPQSIAPVAKIFAQKISKSADGDVEPRRLYVKALDQTKAAWRDHKQAKEAAWILAQYGLVDNDEEVRAVSARILQDLGMPKSIAQVAKIFADEIANGAYHDVESRQLYVQALDQTKAAWHDQKQAEEAVWTLARHGLVDEDDEVRTVSARILQELGMPNSIAQVAKIFADEITSTAGHEANLRRRYVWALHALGAHAEEAAKLLANHAKNEFGAGSQEVRIAAHQILENIRRQKSARQQGKFEQVAEERVQQHSDQRVQHGVF